MSAQELEAALAAPDSSTTRARLSKLVKRDVHIHGSSLPTVAAQYLQAFCDVSIPAAKRRWIGLVLCNLLDKSSDVTEHLSTPRSQKTQRKQQVQGKHTTQLSQLGQILIRDNELEETKIVAGLVIRRALRRGIQFTKYWPSDKVPNSAPEFPTDNGLHWIESFQTYLDILSDLQLMEPVDDSAADSAILYTLCVSTDDGFRWRDPEPIMAIALVEDDKLTIITTDITMKDFNFVDIPLAHILCVDKRKSDIHDSQARDSEHEPWDLVLLLKPLASTYCLNATARTGKEIAIMFQHQKDATECENSINEWRARSSDSGNQASIRQAVDVNVNGNSLSQLDGGGSETRREPVTNRSITSSLLLNATTKETARKANGTSPGSGARSERNNVLHESRTGSIATNVDMKGESPNKSQRKGLKKKFLPSINKSKVDNNYVAIAEEDVFAFPDDHSPVDNSLIAPNASSARIGKPPTAKRRTKAKLSPVKGNVASKSGIRTQGDQDTGEENVNSTPRLLESASASKQPTKLAKSSKRSREDDETQDIHIVSSDQEPGRRKRRRTVKKVSYNEDETLDDPNDSDFIVMEPRINKPVGKQTSPPSDRLPRKSGKSVEAKSTKSKAHTAPEAQSISPVKHSAVSSLLSKSLRSHNGSDPATSSPRTQKTEEVSRKHSQIHKRPVNRKSERQTLDLLNKLLSDGLGEVDNPVPGEDECTNGHMTAENAIPLEKSTDNEEITTMPTVQHSHMLIAAAPRKRAAPSTPVHTPKAKRHKPDLFPEPPTTMAPPRRLEEPNSPSLATKYHQSSQWGTEKIADMAPNGKSKATGLTQSERHLGMATKSVDKDGKEELHTPTTNGFRRTSSGSSEVILLLSSNSKPLPAPPTAESTAISGHSSRGDLQNEQMNEDDRNRDNPFLHSSVTLGAKRFARQLTAKIPQLKKPQAQEPHSPEEITVTQHKMSARQNEIIDLDGDTLIAEDEEPAMNASPIQVHSSPPKVFSSPSSHSSTSAEGEVEGEVDADTHAFTSKEEAEDREWEESLKPYQRTIGTQLTRISQRLLRHIVDNETAVNDIAQTYMTDAKTLVENVEARQKEHFETSVRDIKQSSADVKRKLEGLAAKIRAERGGSA